MQRVVSFFLSLVFLFIMSCKKEDDNHDHEHHEVTNQKYIDAMDCSGTVVTYNNDVKSIFDVSCATSGCHNTKTAAHNIKLTNYDNAKAVFSDHNILCAINHDSECTKMPKGGNKLSDDQIKIITCWAKNNFPE